MDHCWNLQVLAFWDWKAFLRRGPIQNRKLALVGIIPNQRATRIRKTLGSIPGGAVLCFSSDLAVSSSIFVGDERVENLIRGPIQFQSEVERKAY